MPEFLPGAVFSAIVTVAFVIVLRSRAGEPRPPHWQLALIGIVAAFVIPWVVAVAEPILPVVTFDQVFIGACVTLVLLGFGLRPSGRAPVPLWAAALTGVAFAVLLPPLLDLVTGSYQRASLREHVNHCTRGMTGEVQPREVVNTCEEPITVGLCLPGEINPLPCRQTKVLQPGQSALFDPGEARVSSLPSNPDGLTVVACRPPARPSRAKTTMGRGYEGVCLPPG